MKKLIFDVLFIVLSTFILIVLNQFGFFEKYAAFALVPILIAYYLGQFSVKKFKGKSA